MSCLRAPFLRNNIIFIDRIVSRIEFKIGLDFIYKFLKHRYFKSKRNMLTYFFFVNKMATTKRGIYHLLGHCKGRHIAYVYNTVLDRLECYLTVLTSREKYSHKLSLKKNSLKKSKN